MVVMESVSVMDRAYERRHELLAQEGVSWVRMLLDNHGVTLTICHHDGGKEVEFLPKEVLTSETNDTTS